MTSVLGQVWNESRMVAKALGYSGPEKNAVETVSCARCGRETRFDFNTIGQMVEICDPCGIQKLYTGPRTLSREHHVQENGIAADGDIRRVPKEPRGKDRTPRQRPTSGPED